MINKIIGGVLIIIGTSIGGGMLALPIATAGGGFLHSLWLFVAAWAMTMLGAFYILEVNLWLPEHTNMISMARATLGWPGQMITWLSYLVLLYALLAAYIAGGTDLMNHLIERILHLPTPHWLDSMLFVLLFGGIVHCGIFLIDWTNRGLMSAKLIAYVLLIVFIMPHVKATHLHQGTFHLLAGAIMVVITSFGYATVIPSLRSYFKSNVNALRLTILVGSTIPLVCYILWDLVVQGTVRRGQLIHMATSGQSVSDLTQALSHTVNSYTVFNAAHVFTAICVTTSFLGVALCLSDFLADGMKIKRQLHPNRHWIVTITTFLPPLLIILFYPGIFIQALSYAGIICVLLLMLLPALMVWSGRYIKKSANGYQVAGGRFLVIVEIVAAIALILYAMYQLF